MKRILSAALLAITLATPSFAAKLYLKEGGVIEAKRVWRADGKVHVLATRHTLTSFEPAEVDLNRTFSKRHRMAKTSVRRGQQVANAAPVQAAVPRKQADKKSRIALPTLPERSPESLVPSSGGDGTIRKQKKEMEERLKD
ncbi:MAG: hypothetical protein H7X83_01310 [Verrucomicrobia bacterium]|nr:hypothetical protein [Deltaproteobacteria bacterium]